jgi:hypothetical protein
LISCTILISVPTNTFFRLVGHVNLPGQPRVFEPAIGSGIDSGEVGA